MKENGPRGLTITWELPVEAVPTGDPVYYVAFVSYEDGTDVTQESVIGKIFYDNLCDNCCVSIFWDSCHYSNNPTKGKWGGWLLLV